MPFFQTILVNTTYLHMLQNVWKILQFVFKNNLYLRANYDGAGTARSLTVKKLEEVKKKKNKTFCLNLTFGFTGDQLLDYLSFLHRSF